MAIVSMADAVAGQVAIAGEYNKLIGNIQDLDARLGPVVAGSPASTRLTNLESRATSLETLTTNTTTNGGHGNVQLSTRLGTGVGTSSNVTTGHATAQLTDIRSRLTVVEGSVSAAGPLCFLRKSNAQTNFANGTVVPVSFNVEDVDTHNGHDNATNPTRFTVPSGWAGWYEISGGLVFDSVSTTGGRVAIIQKNGADVNGGWGPAMPGSVGQGAMTRVLLLNLAVGDYIELCGRWAGGGTVGLDISTSNQATLNIKWMRA